MKTDDELPVLSDVIQSGDETKIRSTRLQRIGVDRIDTSSRSTLHFELPAHLLFDHLAGNTELDGANDSQSGSVTGDSTADATQNQNPVANESLSLTSVDDELDILIDDIIDKHIVALRRDLRALLERARDLP